MPSKYSSGAAEQKARIAREVDAQVEAAHERAEKARQWRRDVENTVGTGSAEDGAVQVTVRPDGLLSALTVSDDVARRGGRVAERAILDAIAAAQDDVRAKVHSTSVRAWGENDPAVRSLDSEVSASTPSPDALDDGPRTRRDDGGTW